MLSDPWATRDVSEAEKLHPGSAQTPAGPASSGNAPSGAESQKPQSCSFPRLLLLDGAVCEDQRAFPRKKIAVGGCPRKISGDQVSVFKPKGRIWSPRYQMSPTSLVAMTCTKSTSRCLAPGVNPSVAFALSLHSQGHKKGERTPKGSKFWHTKWSCGPGGRDAESAERPGKGLKAISSLMLGNFSSFYSHTVKDFLCLPVCCHLSPQGCSQQPDDEVTRCL